MTTRKTITSLRPGSNYSIRVRAKNDVTVSDWSPKLDFTTTSDSVSPSTPQNLTWVVVGDAFHAEWDSVTTNTGGASILIVRYEVQLTPSVGSARVVSVLPNGSSTKVTYDLSFLNNVALFGSPKPSITAAVRAVDNHGLVSSYTAGVTATNPAPDPPTSPFTTAGTDSLDINWTPPSDTDLIGYNVYTGSTSGFTPSSGNKIGFTPSTHFTYITTTYSLQYFKIRSVDKFNQESTDAVTSGTPVSPFGVDTIPPAVPTGLSATITTLTDSTLATSAAVSWNANSESDLAGYFLQYRVNGTTPYTTVRYDKSTTSAVITGLKPYVNYDFRISAVDWTENQSAYSSIATGTGATNTAPSTPAAPSVSVNTMQAQVTVSGNKAAGGAIESDVNYYEVYGSTTTGFTPGPTNMLGTIPVGPAMVATFQIPTSGGSSTQTWFFKIIAVDNGGLKSSASAQTSGTPGLIAATNIVDATITNAKISDLAVDKLTGGVINTTDINVISKLVMGDSTHTGAIESFGYSSGTTGFHIDKTAFEVNQGSIAAAALKIQLGQNLVPPQFADFEWSSSYYSGQIAYVAGSGSIVTTDKQFNTQSLKWQTTSASNVIDFSPSQTTHNFIINPSTTYILSAYMMIKSTDVAVPQMAINLRYQTASGTTTATGGVRVSIPANDTWARYTVVVTTGSDAVGPAHLIFTHNTSSTTNIYIDGIQVEEKLANSNNPSLWTPPSTTTIDGGMIKTGALQSTATTVVNSTTIPVWSIPLNGAASFANLQVRGNAVIGVAGGTDGGQSLLSSGNYVAGTLGWQLRSDGSAEFVAGVASQTFTGSVFQTAVSGQRMTVENDSSGGVIKMYTGAASETSGYINPDLVDITGLSNFILPSISIRSPTGNGFNTAPTIRITPGGTSTVSPTGMIRTGQIHFKIPNYSGLVGAITIANSEWTSANNFISLGANGFIRATNGLSIDGGGEINGGLDLQGTVNSNGAINVSNNVNITGSGNTVSLANPPSTTSTAVTINYNSTSGNIRQVTSLSQFKLAQQDITIDEARGLLNVTPKTWYDRQEVEENNGTTGLTRYPGFIAEDIESHVPMFAIYNSRGELHSVANDRIPAALLVIVKNQQERIEQLERLVDRGNIV